MISIMSIIDIGERHYKAVVSAGKRILGSKSWWKIGIWGAESMLLRGQTATPMSYLSLTFEMVIVSVAGFQAGLIGEPEALVEREGTKVSLASIFTCNSGHIPFELRNGAIN